LNLVDISDRNNGWQYSRPIGAGAVELGTVCGYDVGLPVHFHDEDQITFVLSGRRRFMIDDELVKVGTGEGMYIPAGVPHRSLAEDGRLLCINVYAMPGECRSDYLISSLSSLRRKQGFLEWNDLMLLIEQHRESNVQGTELHSGSGPDLRHRVSEAAHLSGISREGFSRRFRKLHGIPPRTFQLVGKLNYARRALRSGYSIADVASQAGFSDQSHLGRLFRRTFGVTPGRYRAG
jgi:AraC-like DNA-binding protein